MSVKKLKKKKISQPKTGSNLLISFLQDMSFGDRRDKERLCSEFKKSESNIIPYVEQARYNRPDVAVVRNVVQRIGKKSFKPI
jgi:hypothetical protein